MRIGLISDTHLPSSIREPWPEVAQAFRQVDLILHAGDIVTPRILDWLEDIAPVLAALGNNDFGMDEARMQGLLDEVERVGQQLAEDDLRIYGQ